MGIEIERKFLVRDTSVLDGRTGVIYRQGYLANEVDRTVRVRRAGDHAFMTVKGRTVGASRAEFEYAIPVEDAVALLEMCPVVVEKVRYRIPVEGVVFEVDRFAGANDGLIVAELELPSEDAAYPRPTWLGAEVTDDPRYLNARLAVEPFSRWHDPV
jgi:adenylate cyclase